MVERSEASIPSVQPGSAATRPKAAEPTGGGWALRQAKSFKARSGLQRPMGHDPDFSGYERVNVGHVLVTCPCRERKNIIAALKNKSGHVPGNSTRSCAPEMSVQNPGEQRMIKRSEASILSVQPGSVKNISCPCFTGQQFSTIEP